MLQPVKRIRTLAAWAPALLVAMVPGHALAAPRGNTAIASFEHAKVHLRILYAEHPETLYSGCAFDPTGHVDYQHCPWSPQRDTPRAHKIEWEHVVPAYALGHNLPAWRDGDPTCVDSHGMSFIGRRCAQRADPNYRLMEADLYNLYPEIGEVNQIRSNRIMDAIAEPTAHLAPIDARLGPKAFEPRPEVRGEVARTYLYMFKTYPLLGELSDRRRRLYRAWAQQDPVDAWECRRASRIAAIQRNANPIVQKACIKAGLWPDDGSPAVKTAPAKVLAKAAKPPQAPKVSPVASPRPPTPPALGPAAPAQQTLDPVREALDELWREPEGPQSVDAPRE